MWIALYDDRLHVQHAPSIWHISILTVAYQTSHFARQKCQLRSWAFSCLLRPYLLSTALLRQMILASVIIDQGVRLTYDTIYRSYEGRCTTFWSLLIVNNITQLRVPDIISSSISNRVNQ
jgi:hypothetical protein